MGTKPEPRQELAAAVPITTSVGHLMRRVTQRYSAVWSSVVGRESTPVQLTTLSVLDALGDVDQATLGQYASLDRSTCGALVERLRGTGLVRANTDPADRRRRIISITDQGRQWVARYGPGEREVERMARHALTGQEYDTLRAILTKLALTMGGGPDVSEHGSHSPDTRGA